MSVQVKDLSTVFKEVYSDPLKELLEYLLASKFLDIPFYDLIKKSHVEVKRLVHEKKFNTKFNLMLEE